MKDISLGPALGRAAELVKINVIRKHRLWGRVGIMKRRNPTSWLIARLANFYFWMARVPIRFLTGRAWQRWEAGCFRMMNDGLEASAIGEDRVWADKVPGKALMEHLQAGTLRRKMLIAAGREFRRCHARWSAELHGQWSHGDATMSNIMYDGRRARFIDFEIMHVKNMPAVQRHADDLLVFLLDLVGYAPERRWIPWSTAFLQAYNDDGTIAELRKLLVPWHGLSKIWWKQRTNSAADDTLARRLAALRAALDQKSLHAPSA